MTERRFSLKYGQKKIEAIVNKGREPDVLVAHSINAENDPADLTRKTLDSPIDSPPLDQVVSKGDKVAIVASDTTRATASDIFLPILVERLNNIGIPDHDIDIVIALGIHRRQTEEEHKRLLGGDLYMRIKPVDHDARDKNNLVPYGKTSRGTDVAINHKVANANKVILTGAVSPHYFAGFGGGRKSVMPGVCSLEANLQSHLLVFKPPPDHGRRDNVSAARLDGNPVHEDMLEAAKMVGPDFILNTILTPEKELAAAFAGSLDAAHRAACKYYLDRFSVVAPRRADLTIVSGGGYPKDINFIQSHKAIHNAFSVTKPGGWMIVLAECPDGFGYTDFADWFRFDNASDFEDGLRADYHIYGQTAYATFEKATAINIVLVSGLHEEDLERMRMFPADSFETAYNIATKSLGDDFTTYVIPAASSTLLMTQKESDLAMASVVGDR